MVAFSLCCLELMMNEAYEAAIAVAFQSQTPTSLDVVIEIEIGAFICVLFVTKRLLKRLNFYVL